MTDLITTNPNPFFPCNYYDDKEDNYKYDRMIEEELYKFLSSVIDEYKPDIIIVVERKATALFRALKELKLINKQWSQLISSAVLEEIDESKIVNSNILIFDDMMRTGEHLSDVLKQLHNNFSIQPEQLMIAVFAIHQISNLSISCDGFEYPITKWYYKNLDDYSYSLVRNRIISLLERTGSLLLDTEHIEIRLKPKYDFTELIQALQISGKVISFNSQSNRKNITVLISERDENGTVVNKILNDHLYPDGIITENIVMKCRIIERPNGEIAILPICYPAVPCELNEKWEESIEIVEIFGNQLSNSNNSVFYAIGLLAAIDVLSWIIKILAGAGYISESEEELVLPSINDLDFPGSSYTLNHLRVMYPFLDIKSITNRINSCVLKARKKGNQAKSKISKVTPNVYANVDDSKLYRESFSLAQGILYKILNKKFDLYSDTLVKNPHPFGLRSSEIYSIAKEIGVTEQQEISCLFDLMIDSGLIITHVEKRYIDHNGDTKLYRVRTFEIDGEVVTQMLIDFTDQNGFPWKS